MIQLHRSRKELDNARVALARMKEIFAARPVDADAYEVAWFELLGSLERVWYKAKSQAKAHPRGFSWNGQWEKLRKSDPLLSYLSKSRGADEHSHLEVVSRSLGIREITKLDGPMIYVGKAGKNIPVLVDGEKHRIHLDPRTMQLKPIEFRGQVYAVPKMHLGKKILQPSSVTMAELGIVFYERFILESESYLYRSRD